MINDRATKLVASDTSEWSPRSVIIQNDDPTRIVGELAIGQTSAKESEVDILRKGSDRELLRRGKSAESDECEREEGNESFHGLKGLTLIRRRI
ncbi:MAG: hypothetical protein ACI8T1_001915 [Verrucomicrobiales bacterium]|jgi:hypothetical protein